MEAVQGHIEVTPLRIPTGKSRVDGDLSIPDGCKGMVVFSHGSGTGRRNPRNRALSDTLNQAGYATLLLDLLTAHEEFQDESTAEFRFDIPLLARRLIDATEWLAWNRDTASLKMAKVPCTLQVLANAAYGGPDFPPDPRFLLHFGLSTGLSNKFPATRTKGMRA